MSARLVAIVALLALFALVGCGAQGTVPSGSTLRTEAQIDTAIARSDLPGARTVDRALAVSGAQATRVAGLDSLR
jgi:hypothetical protein